MKKLGKVLLWTLGIIVVLLLASPLWLGPVAKCVANSVVPGMVGTDFRLGKLGINMYTGGVAAGDMQLANPEGFSKENCLELGNLDVDVAMTSLLSKKIRVESIEVDGLYIATTMGGGNFIKIADNASGGEASEEVAESVRPAAPEASTPEVKKDDGVKVQIDRIVLKNMKIKYGSVPVPIPTITLEGIGADSPDGATLQDVWNAVYDAILKASSAVGDLVSAIGGAAAGAVGNAVGVVGDIAGSVGGAVGGAAGAVGNAIGGAAGTVGDAAMGAAGAVGDTVSDAAGAVGDAVGDAAGAVGDTASSTAGSVSDAVGDVAGAVGDTVSSAAGAVGDAAGAVGDAAMGAASKTMESIGDAAGKAADMIKGVFK